MKYNKAILSPGIAYGDLATIKGVRFTPREIDVIACLLAARGTKTIAQILSIEEKTVETHKYNVMRKLECNSKESIIDFIEKSGSFSLVRNHYQWLLIQSVFAQKLKNIIPSHNRAENNCLLIYWNEEKDKLSFVYQVENHLKLAKIKTVITESQQATNYLTSAPISQSIICFLSVSLLNQLEIASVGQSDIAQFLQEVFKYSENVVVALYHEKDFTSVPKKSVDITYIDFKGEKEYFSSLFRLLDHLFSFKNIKKIREEFFDEVKKIRNNSEICIENRISKTQIHSATLGALSKRKIKFYYWGIGIVSITILSIFLLTWHKENLNLLNNNILEKHSLSGSDNVNAKEVENENELNLEKAPNISPYLVKVNDDQEPIIWNLPRQDNLFIGRKKLLEKLDTELNLKKTSQSVLLQSKEEQKQLITNKLLAVSVCAGMGGVGKTQLALQYIYHTKYPFTLKAWFQAENPEQLKHQYIEFAKVVGYRERKPSIKTAKLYVKDWLINHPGWLLVYDNVNDYEEIKDFLPTTGGSIIVTTRQQKWPNSFKTLDIDVMTEEESIELIQSLIQRKLTEEEKNKLKELVKLLGYLPLASAQAGAYIRQTQMTIADYLSLYKNYEQELLADNTLPKGTSSLPVAITWNITINAIIKEAMADNQPPLALHLLCVCAYLAPEQISRNLLLTWIKENYPNLSSPELILSKLIGQLLQYSMVKREKNGDITVHRLVQSAVSYQHKQASSKKDPNYLPLTLEWYNALLKCIHNEFSYKIRVLEDEVRQQNLLAHLQMLLNHYKKIWPNASEFNLVPIFNDIGIVFFLIGEPKTAQFYYERALVLLDNNYGKDHPQLVDTLINLGYTYRSLGETNQTKKVSERTLLILEKNYDKNYFKIASPLDCLGYAYREEGDIKHARDIHLRALPILEQHYGKNHFEVARVLEHLGMDYRDLGDFKKAIEFYERAMKIKEKFFPKDHFELAVTLDHLGRAYRNSGEVKKAKELCERSLRIKENFFGKEHFELAITLDYLGRTYRDLGNAQQAKELHERALKIKENFFGTDHFLTAFTIDQLGRDYRDLGNAQQAKELHERALKIKENFFGTDHSQEKFHIVATTLDYLASSYRDLGNAQQATELHTRVLKVAEQFHGNNHTAVAYILDQLGRDYGNLGAFKKAKALHERALKIKEKDFGTDHVEVAITLNYLGNDYRSLGNAQQAKELHEHALKIKKEYYGKDHVEVAITLDHLGDDYRSLGNAQQAKELHEHALKIKKKYYGKDHVEVAITLDHLGDDYRSLGNAQQAKELHEHALKIKKKYYGKDHVEVAITLDHLASDYRSLGNAKHAKELHERGIKIKEEYYGKVSEFLREHKT